MNRLLGSVALTTIVIACAAARPPAHDVVPQPVGFVEQARLRCENRETDGCLELGYHLARATPDLRDRQRARKIYRSLCEGADGGKSCAELRWLEAEPQFPANKDTPDGSSDEPEAPDGGGATAGGLPREVIYAVIKWHEREISWCYERLLASDNQAEGSASAKWTIDPSGYVSTAEIVNSTMPSELGRCIARQIGAWRFPEPEGGGVVNVTFPWLFRTAKPQDAGVLTPW